MTVWQKAIGFSLAGCLVAGSAAAQAGSCVIDTDKPGQLKSAKILLVKSQMGGKPEEQAKQAKAAVKLLTEKPEKINNEIGRNYLLGQALAWWAGRPGMATVVRRADLGYVGSPEAMVDVLAAADSAFAAVEAAKPECVSETEGFRRPLWGVFIEQSAELINTDKLDSAEIALKRADIANKTAPHASYFRAIIAQKRNDVPGALASYKRTIDAIPTEAAAKDSNYAAIRNQVMFNYAQLLQLQADRAKGEQQKTAARVAADAYRAFLTAYPNDPQTVNAQSGLATVLALTGDTTAVISSYADLLANPSKYTALQLFVAGTSAFQADRKKDAAVLLERSVAMNPWYRDALYNLANTYLALDQYDKLLGVSQKLVAVDPNYPDNWYLQALAWQGISKATKDAKLRSAQIDSALKYNEKKKGVAVRVNVTHFSHEGATHTLAGSVENLGAAAGNYTLKFQFLDKDGQVVSSKEMTVGPVQPKSTQPFKVEVEQSGIVAYRYAAI